MFPLPSTPLLTFLLPYLFSHTGLLLSHLFFPLCFLLAVSLCPPVPCASCWAASLRSVLGARYSPGGSGKNAAHSSFPRPLSRFCSLAAHRRLPEQRWQEPIVWWSDVREAASPLFLLLSPWQGAERVPRFPSAKEREAQKPGGSAGLSRDLACRCWSRPAVTLLRVAGFVLKQKVFHGNAFMEVIRNFVLQHCPLCNAAMPRRCLLPWVLPTGVGRQRGCPVPTGCSPPDTAVPPSCRLQSPELLRVWLLPCQRTGEMRLPRAVSNLTVRGHTGLS